ncbi:2-keto-4-pentenoate hydratase [Halopseudomonas sabulinigri]|uniref:2-keto-4-pentenoate hydratase n=1 Tax=Halopseudomonas sabulinigri TaxID=472181 RepID=A0ABP9ZPI1_9GAMM
MTTTSQAVEAARLLLQARADKTPCASIVERCQIDDLTQAYAAQRQWQQLSLARGDRIAGYKLGVSNPKAQAALGLNGPLQGVLLASAQRQAGATLSYADFLAPRAEIEVAMVFAEALSDPELDRSQLVAALHAIVPALEICDSAIAGWPKTLFDAVADNLSSGGYLLGEPQRNSTGIDVSALTATLEINGEQVAEGNTGSAMGDPIDACLWLVRDLLRKGGGIKAGDIILTGALTGLHPIAAGDQLRLRMGELGEVSCRFEA